MNTEQINLKKNLFIRISTYSLQLIIDFHNDLIKIISKSEKTLISKKEKIELSGEFFINV